MPYPIKRGFLDYGDNSDSTIILSTPLTSAASLPSGSVVTDTNSRITYTDAGVMMTTVANLAADITSGGGAGPYSKINFSGALTDAQRARMQGGFTATCWVEKGWFSESVAANGTESEYLLAAPGWGLLKAAGGYNHKILMGSTSGAFNSTIIGKSDYVRVDFSYTGGNETIVYLDYLPFAKLEGTKQASTIFDTFFGLGYNTASGCPVPGYRIKNFMVRDTPVVLDVRNKFSSIYMMGHSWGVGSDHANAASAITGDKGGAYLDGRASPKICRILGEHGVGIPEGKIRNTSVSSVKVAGTNGLSAQVTTATTSGKKLKVALLQFGTNEVISGTGTLASEYATLQTDYQTGITALIAAGADVILCGNTVSTALSSLYGTGSANWLAYKQRCEDMNTIHAAIVAANSKCSLVDLFTAFGGHNLSTTYITSGDYHPTVLGYQLVGTTFANELIRRL